VASIITIAGAILLTDYSSEIVLGIAIYTSTYYLMAVIAPLTSLLVGNERVDVISVMGVVNQILFMILGGLFVYLGFSFVGLVVASALVWPVVGILDYIVIRRNKLGPPQFKLNRAMWMHLIRGGIPFAVVQLSQTFSFQVDTIFLSNYTSAEVVGWYSAAYRIVISLLTMFRSFNDAVLPTLSREHSSNPATVSTWYYTSVRFILMLALPIAVGGSILNYLIVVLYGSEFQPSGLAFAILIWDIPFVMYHAFCGNITTSIRREANAARIYVTIGILNIVLNGLLIPRFGIVAACFTTVVTDFFGAALFYMVLRRELGPGLKLRRLIWIAIASGAMGLFVFLLREINVFVLIGLGGALYLLIVWFTPALTGDERRQILALAGQVARRLHIHPART
jgi:O-antigen/teichoic acid export membrane protein